MSHGNGYKKWLQNRFEPQILYTHRVVVHVARGCKAKQDLRTYFLLHSNVHILHIKYTIQKDNNIGNCKDISQKAGV